MLDNPKGRDCNEMVGYQVRQSFMLTFAIIDVLKVIAVKISRSAKFQHKGDVT